MRHTLREEYERRQRRWQSTGEKDLPNLLAQIEELNDLDEQIRFVEQATRLGFKLFQLPDKGKRQDHNPFDRLMQGSPAAADVQILENKRQMYEMQLKIRVRRRSSASRPRGWWWPPCPRGSPQGVAAPLHQGSRSSLCRTRRPRRGGPRSREPSRQPR